jgi:hypothetical protein
LATDSVADGPDLATGVPIASVQDGKAAPAKSGSYETADADSVALSVGH